MTDLEIESGLVRRDEEALLSLQDRYGAYCFSIALRLLRDEELARECVSDVYLGVWNADEPPRNLKAYLAKAVRNTALHYIERSKAQKRSANLVLLDELAECLPDPRREGELENRLLKDCLNRFVRSLRQEERQLFLLRYLSCLDGRVFYQTDGMEYFWYEPETRITCQYQKGQTREVFLFSGETNDYFYGYYNVNSLEYSVWGKDFCRISKLDFYEENYQAAVPFPLY